MSKKITFQYLREVRYKSTEELFPHWITADFIIDKLFKKHTLQFPQVDLSTTLNVVHIIFFDKAGRELLEGIQPKEKITIEKQLNLLLTVVLGKTFFDEFMYQKQDQKIQYTINTKIQNELIDFERKMRLTYSRLLSHFLGLDKIWGLEEAIIKFHKNSKANLEKR